MKSFRKSLAVSLTAVMALGVFASPVFAMEDGTYTGAAQGMASNVTVELTVADGAITDVAVDVSGETEGIGAAIGEDVTAQILEAQGSGIDGVAGATVTSDAVRAAVDSALAAALGEAPDADARS